MNGEKTNSIDLKPKLSLGSMFWSIRPVNILIVALTQFTFYFILFICNASKLHLTLNLDGFILYAFIFTTVIITACGYLINDYFDFDSDLLNSKNHRFPNQWHYLPAYFSLLFVGLVISFLIALKLGRPELTLFYLGASVLLFLYSTHIKRIPLIGNVIVALFSASVILVFLIFESNFISILQTANIEIYKNFQITFIFYGLFIFLLSLVREIIKDIEDVKGDSLNGDNTIAVVNLSLARKLSITLSFALLLIEIFYAINLPTQLLSIIGIGIIIVPQILLLFRLINATAKTDYIASSILAKINMILGLLFLIILNLNLQI